MTTDERSLVLKQLTVLAERYQRPQSDAQLVLYLADLDPYPCEFVLAALERHAAESPYYPRMTELRRQIEGWQAQRHREEQAGIWAAWRLRTRYGVDVNCIEGDMSPGVNSGPLSPQNSPRTAITAPGTTNRKLADSSSVRTVS